MLGGETFNATLIREGFATAIRRFPYFIETVGWLKAAERSFEFWDNPADAVYDTL